MKRIDQCSDVSILKGMLSEYDSILHINRAKLRDAYMDIWNLTLGQELILKPEPNRTHYKDKHADAVLKDDVIVR